MAVPADLNSPPGQSVGKLESALPCLEEYPEIGEMPGAVLEAGGSYS